MAAVLQSIQGNPQAGLKKPKPLPPKPPANNINNILANALANMFKNVNAQESTPGGSWSQDNAEKPDTSTNLPFGVVVD